MIDNLLRQGLNADHASKQLVRQGIVRDIRTITDSTTGGLQGLIANVEVKTRHGRPRVIYGCTTNIPIQVGSHVVMAVQYADQQRGGFIFGLTTPPQLQIVESESPVNAGLLLTQYVEPDGTGGSYGPYTPVVNDDKTVSYVDDATGSLQNREVWITHDIAEQVRFDFGQFLPESLSDADRDALIAAMRVEEQQFRTGSIISDASKVLGTPHATPPNIIPVPGADPDGSGFFTPGRLRTGNEGYVVVTGDEMGFNCELQFDTFSTVVYELSGSDYETVAGTPRGGIGVLSEDETQTLEGDVRYLVALWLVLHDETTGQEYLADGRNRVLRMTVPETIRSTRTLHVNNQLTGIPVSKAIIFQTDGTLVRQRFAFPATFHDMAQSFGHRLRLDLYMQVTAGTVAEASAVVAQQVRFRGQWKLRLQEAGYGSALRSFS